MKADNSRKKPPRKAAYLKFTKRALEALKPGDRLYYYDLEVRGLRLAVHEKGRKTFSLYRKFHGHPTTVPLGEFPHVSVEQARNEAAQKIAMIARDENPRRPPTDKLRLGEFFEGQYLPQHFDNNPRAQRNARATFKRYLWKWRDVPLADITREDVERLHKRISRAVVDPKTKRQKGGPVAANRLLALVSGIYTKARDWNVFRGSNPARGVQRGPESPRTRVLDRNGESQKFFDALAREKDVDLRLYLKVRIFNGCRGNNILSMRWEDIDVEKWKWHIGETKTGVPLIVDLANPVIDELVQRERRGEWVFPGHKRGTHLNTIDKRWRRFRKSLKLSENVELRDLRRTFASYALWSGVPEKLIGNLMGHAPGSRITAVTYMQPDERLRREAITRINQNMLAEVNDGT